MNIHGLVGATLMALTQILALMFRQILILAPTFTQFLAFLRGQISKVSISLTGLLALLRCELCPLVHACLQALLSFRRHVGIAFGNLQPSLAAFGFKLIPFLFERCQRLALLGGELRPRRRRLCSDCRWCRQQQEGSGYCCRSCEVCESHASNPGSVYA